MTQTISELVERAFDYRGNVTIQRRDGSQVVGFVYDRGPAHVELYDEHALERIRLPLADVADVAFTGDDHAAKGHQIWERRKDAVATAATAAARPLLVVVALPLELRAVARALGSSGKQRAGGEHRVAGDRVVAIAVGVGGGAARAVAAEAPALVISCGFAGALEASLSPGDLVLATGVRDELGGQIPVPHPLLGAARHAVGVAASIGEIACVSEVAVTRAEKRALAGSRRLAVDLETWAVAKAAHDAGIPWLALRAIVDPLEADLPAFTRRRHGRYLGPALRHALTHARGLGDLARLALWARAANRSLESALARLVAAAPELRAAGGAAA